MAADAELTPREDRFVREYLVEPNATRAYLRAYTTRQYAPTYNTARFEASKLLAKPHIRAAVEAGRRELRRELRVDALRVLRELAAIAFADPLDAWEYDEATGREWARPLRDVPAAFRRAVVGRKATRRRLAGAGDEVYEVESVEYKQADKLAALDRLCRHLGLTKDGAALEAILDLLRQDRAAAEPPPPAGRPAGGRTPQVGGDADRAAVE